MSENPQENTQNSQPAAPSFMLKGQYIKDLSFESPAAPASLVQVQQNTNIELDFDLVVNNMQNDMYEIVLKINSRAIADSNTIFVVELAYGGVLS